MFVESQRLLPIGTSVRLGLALARHSVELFGRVAWSRSGPLEDGRGMGIRFVAVRPETSALLRDVVGARVASRRQARPSRPLNLPLPPDPEPEPEPQPPPAVRRPGRAALAFLFLSVAAAVAALVATALIVHGPPPH